MSNSGTYLGEQISEFDTRQSKALLSLVFAASSAGMCVMTALRNEQNTIVDFECTLANGAMEEQTGFFPLTGRKLTDLQSLISPAIPVNQVVEVVSENKRLDKEVAFSGYNGFRWLKMVILKFEDGILMISEDITSSANIEEQIRHQTMLFTKVIESSPDIIQIVSLTSGKSTYINKMLLEELKYPFEEIKRIENGKGIRTLIHADDIVAYDIFLNDIRHATNDTTVETEMRVLSYDRTWKWYRTRARVFERDPFGVPRKFVAFSQDVTPQKSAEEEKRNHQMLREVEKARTTFFNNVSHEFRTPLTLLLAPLQEILTRQAVFKYDLDKIQMAYRNARRLQKLVNTLLDFSQIESGRLNAVYQPTNLAKFTDDLASNFRSIIEHAGLKFKVSCAAVDELVYINRDMYEKILFNLLSNAFKYTLKGKIEVILKDNKNHVKLIVRDTGAGIEEKHLEKIFDRFARIEGKKARTYEGSGIGLSLVRELVNYHRGSIRVASEPGKGSAFAVTLYKGKAHLPRRNIFEFNDDKAESGFAGIYIDDLKGWTTGFQGYGDSVRPARGAKGSADKKPLILVVDDNADMRGYLKKLLSDQYEVVVATNGKAAMESMQQDKLPELILSDVMMPEVSGYDLLQMVRRNERTKDIPVILVTAKADDESKIEGLKIGADDYLVKPFSGKELVARVDARIQIARAQKLVSHALKDVNQQLEQKITERTGEIQETNTVLAERNEELQSLNTDLSAFAFVAGHDLTEPLRKIQLYANYIQSHSATDLPVDAQDALQRILASVERMRSLVNDIRTYSILLADHRSIEKVDLTDTFHQLTTILKSAIGETGAVLEYAGLPVLKCNPIQILQLFHNILSNSIKFRMPGLPPEIKIVAAMIPANRIAHPMAVPTKKYLRIEIKDNGVGFEQKYELKIFQMFQQLHNRNQYPGSGMGLAICKRIAENHKGFITAKSEPGGGATFCCYFPEELVG